MAIKSASKGRLGHWHLKQLWHFFSPFGNTILSGLGKGPLPHCREPYLQRLAKATQKHRTGNWRYVVLYRTDKMLRVKDRAFGDSIRSRTSACLAKSPPAGYAHPHQPVTLRRKIICVAIKSARQGPSWPWHLTQFGAFSRSEADLVGLGKRPVTSLPRICLIFAVD